MMKPERKRRLFLVLGSILAIAMGLALVLYAMRQNINFFYTPTEIATGKAMQQAGLDRTINIGGLVVKGSVKRDPNSLKVEFKLSDTESEVQVFYDGILPDLFREGQGIIGIGKLSADNTVQASQILAKHDENYMSPEVAAAIKEAEDRHKAKLAAERAVAGQTPSAGETSVTDPAVAEPAADVAPAAYGTSP